ncbi:uncharacterized protein LOC132711999 isoform X2 [Pantherophis guttatus]|uniref:Uncharacterized protein LOC132711999 isoform X2 n=1 Tax=Pantherophis guttatus TaxID=94885 RepID=A0ABM3ZIH1_PANGU|nr:uncharacterized protein LOC132711999 isoform X2 [Pantherophis guttatus]
MKKLQLLKKSLNGCKKNFPLNSNVKQENQTGIHQIQEPLLTNLIHEFSDVFTEGLDEPREPESEVEDRDATRGEDNLPEDFVPAMAPPQANKEPTDTTSGTSLVLSPNPHEPEGLRRSGCVRRRPTYLEDYVCAL